MSSKHQLRQDFSQLAAKEFDIEIVYLNVQIRKNITYNILKYILFYNIYFKELKIKKNTNMTNASILNVNMP